MCEIRDLNVPGGWDYSFQTELFEPYSRSIGMDELIMALSSNGISTMNTAEIKNTLFRIDIQN